VNKLLLSGGIPRFLPMFGVMAAIFIAASLPGEMMPFLHRHQFDKVCHAIAYATLTASCLFAFNWQWEKHPFLAGFKVTFICFAYALAEEAYQLLIPQRVTDSRDIMADLSGIIIVVVGRRLLSIVKNKPS
jgi:VanZ family protein